MNKRIAKKHPDEDFADTVSRLLEFAQHIRLPDGAFDDEIADCCNEDARKNTELMQNETLMGQLEFLLAHNYAASRLQELMREAKEENRDD